VQGLAVTHRLDRLLGTSVDLRAPQIEVDRIRAHVGLVVGRLVISLVRELAPELFRGVFRE
jgi:hypothetical protein